MNMNNDKNSDNHGNNKHLTSISKFLSLVLRHQPQKIGLQLDGAGWVGIDELQTRAAAHGKTISRALLQQVVASNDKQRFAISEDGLRIRANQGHTIAIDLGLTPAVPPARLLHGTASRFLDAILQQGLDKRQRHHVHLTTREDIARSVGQRYGKVVMLAIDAEAMQRDGHVFYESENHVWLTEHVPPRYLTIIEEAPR